MSVASLRAFARAPQPERCDLCAATIAPEHDHLVDPAGALKCACRACAPLLGDGRWRRVEPRVQPIASPSDAAWAALDVPVAIAFVVRVATGLVVRYPSPAGLAQGDVAPAAFAALGLPELAQDVEAVLVDRRRAPVAYRVSIDECYRLAGVLRARQDPDAWFAELARRARA